MKRCPECLFIYPDSDTRCDFENTLLVAVDESVIEAVTDQPPKKTKRKRTTRKRTTQKRTTKKRPGKATALTAIIGLLLGLSAFAIYYRATHHKSTTLTHNSTATTPNTAQLPAPPITRAQTQATPITPPIPLPTPTQFPTSKPATERVATAHTTTTANPISTSGPVKNGKTTILLTTGSKISADEVWRTRDGVWYRRDGIVTLLKRGQVKAIVNQ